MSRVGQRGIFWNRRGEKNADKEINCVTHQKWRRSDTLPTVSRAFGTCQRVCLILLSCVLFYCVPTSLLILSFVALTLKAFRCFLFWTSIGNNSRAECLSWSVIFDVIPSVSNSFPKQAQVSYVIYFISQSHLISCVSGPLCTSWLTCCVYYDSRPDSPHITIGPSGWHRQTGRQWEGRRLRHGIFDQRLAQSSRKLKQLATQIHRCIIILMAWH